MANCDSLSGEWLSYSSREATRPSDCMQELPRPLLLSCADSFDSLKGPSAT